MEKNTPSKEIQEKLFKDLSNYGSIPDKDKPIIVSGILLALQEIEHKSFSIADLTGDVHTTDGSKIFDAIENNLEKANLPINTDKNKLLHQFSVIKDNMKLSEYNPALSGTPLKYYTQILNNNFYENLKNTLSVDDYLGQMYVNARGDGQNLGIILTPKHIIELSCDLVNIKPDDKVLDPCCGTGGFLVAAMHSMLAQTDDENQKRAIKRNQIFGVEYQPYMFTITTANMLLRGDGKSNIENLDFLNLNPTETRKLGCTVGLMNPPYSQGKNDPDKSEISFIEKLLDSIIDNGRVAVIVPQSVMVGKTTREKNIRNHILKKHTIEGVITVNKNTFYGVGTSPCITIFTAGKPHDANKKVKFINFEDDGYVVSKHVGLVETLEAKTKKQYLLDVWFNRIDYESKFCVETTIEPDDEWLHSFYYFNDEIPSDEDFERAIGDYLTFEFSMIMQNREYLFDKDTKD